MRVKVDVGSAIQAQAQAKPRMRRQISVIAEKYRKARQFGYVWFHAKVLPKMSPKAQNFIQNFENTIVSTYENYWRFMTMPETKKLLIVMLFFSIGATGFCVSYSIFEICLFSSPANC